MKNVFYIREVVFVYWSVPESIQCTSANGSEAQNAKTVTKEALRPGFTVNK